MSRPLTSFPTQTGKGSLVVCVLVFSGFFLAGFGLFAASFIPYDVLAVKVRGLSASGQAAFFDAGFYRAMQLRLRTIGLGDLAVAGIVVRFRTAIAVAVRRLWTDAHRLVTDGRACARLVPAFDRLGLLAITLWAAWLRIPLLSQPMRDDEAYTFLQYSSRPFYVGLSFYNAPNNHLFHTLLVRLAYIALGNHPWVLRLPVLIAGLCLVPSAYAAARILYKGDCGLLAAGLVATSSTLIEFSTNARGYGLVCLAFVLLIPVAAYALRSDNWAAWAVFVGISALGFYAIPVMLYPFGGLAVWLITSAVTGDARPNGRTVILAVFWVSLLTAVATAELYSPVIAVSGPKSVLANKWVMRIPVKIFLQGFPHSLASTWHEWNRDVPWQLTALLVTGFVVALVFHRRPARQRVPLVAATLVWIAPLLIVQRVIPFERVWLFALPLYFIVASAGLTYASAPLFQRLHLQRAMVAVLLAVPLVVGVRTWQSRSVYLSNQSRGLEELARDLKMRLQFGDSLVTVLPSDSPLMYYLQKEGVSWSYINSSVHKRTFVVVNEAAGDSVRSVLALARLSELDTCSARQLAKYETAVLYEVEPAPCSS